MKSSPQISAPRNGVTALKARGRQSSPRKVWQRCQDLRLKTAECQDLDLRGANFWCSRIAKGGLNVECKVDDVDVDDDDDDDDDDVDDDDDDDDDKSRFKWFWTKYKQWNNYRFQIWTSNQPTLQRIAVAERRPASSSWHAPKHRPDGRKNRMSVILGAAEMQMGVS